MPFGEELGAGVGPRTTNLKYSITGLDNVRQRFTGYEKDEETDLDFAEARMYQNKHGRFTAVDPLLASASAADPQTFNRYTYTGNNPINYTDPRGLCRINGKPEDGKPCPNSRGRIFVNADASSFSTVQENGFVPYTGPAITRNFYGVDFRITSSGWTQLGPTESVEVSSAGNGTAPGELPTESGVVSSNITPRGALPLPCRMEGGCGTEPIYSNPLTEGASAEEILSAVETGAAIAGQLPVLGEPIDLFIGGGASLLRGDTEGALLSVASAIPGPVGNAAGITKIGRKAANAVDIVGDAARTTPSLPAKTIAMQDGVTIHHNYKSNDHLPPHAHVKGGGPETKIGANGKPIKGSPELTSKQQAAVAKNKSVVRRDINKIRKWLKYNKWGK